MTIFNVGSINADLFYRLGALPAPGETIAALEHHRGLGGKGANQSVAAALAGSTVVHVGAVGADGDWARERLRGFGVDVAHVATVSAPTAHAIVMVDRQGENSIVICPGANRALTPDQIEQALGGAAAGDILLLQNETNALELAARMGREKEMRVIYSAAPFVLEDVRNLLPLTSVLIVNEIESSQLCTALDTDIADLPVPAILVTKGADGAEFHDLAAGSMASVSAPRVEPVDTTGAGDTFAGYFAAGLDQGLDVRAAMQWAAAAAALKVTRSGTADAIPSAAEVATFTGARG